MASGRTSNYNIPYPLQTDNVDIASDVRDLAVQVDTYLSLKANRNSPTFTGTPVAPTAAIDTNTTQIATTAFVLGQGYLKSSTGSSTYSPVAGSTDIATVGTITSGIWQGTAISSTYIDTAIARLSSPVFTGTPSAPTAAADTSSTQIATTEFVINQGYSKTSGKLSQFASTSSSELASILSDETGTGKIVFDNNPALSGIPTAPTAAADTSTTQIATTAFVLNQGYLKSSTASSTYAPLASPNLTGTPNAPTAAVDTNTTQIATTAYVISQGYLKSSSASSTYLTKTDASSTYLTQSNASSTYLTQSNASSTYLTQSNASSSYQPLDADLTSIAGIAGTSGLLKKTAADTWALDTNTYLTTSNASSTYLTQSNASSTYAPLSGATFTGTVVLNADPSADMQAATKQYVDAKINGLTWKAAVNLIATSNIPLTGSSGSIVIDGHAALTSSHNGYRLLLTGQTTASQKGIYVYSDAGSGYTLSRSADADSYSELIGASVFVEEGTSYGKTSWVQSNTYLTSFSGQTWAQVSGQGTYTAGTGITLSGGEFSNSGVLSITGTANQITASASTGSVTLSLPSSINVNISGNAATVTNGVYTSSTLYIGTTSITLNRASASQTLSGISIDGNAATVTNGVYTNGTYSNPSWLTGLVWSKISSTPTTLSGYGITDAVSSSSVIAANYGGTGQSSYAIGDILYASSSSALSKLAGVATGNALISGGVTTAPSWGKIGLTTHVSGTLPVANGGTGSTTSTGSGSVVLATSPSISGGTISNATSITLTGAQTLASYRVRNIYVSTTDPGTGSEGDIWLKY
jgi:hypothetical protein